MKSNSLFRKFFIRVVLASASLAPLAAPLERAYAEEEKQPVRKFNDVLFDLLNEFSYDLKINQAQNIKNASIRRVALSEVIPKSYEPYLESLVLERIRQHSKIRVIQCTTCRIKRSSVENGKLIISMPINNPAELDNIAVQQGIDTWIDVALLYQESGMILAFNAFDSKTKELVWTKTYNSETIYRKQLNADPVDSSNGGKDEDLRTPSSYVAAFSVGWHMVPNVTTTSNMLGFNLRVSEQFNFKRSEIGGMLVPIIDPGVLTKNYSNVEGDPTTTGEVTAETVKKSIKPFQYGLGLFATYHHHFITLPENYELIRYGMHLGLGGIYAPGYLTFTGRSGMIMKFGRKFFLEFGVSYSMPTTITVKDSFTYKTKGGVGADGTFGFLF